MYNSDRFYLSKFSLNADYLRETNVIRGTDLLSSPTPYRNDPHDQTHAYSLNLGAQGSQLAPDPSVSQLKTGQAIRP